MKFLNKLLILCLAADAEILKDVTIPNQKEEAKMKSRTSKKQRRI